jgi:hypothetical protein
LYRLTLPRWTTARYGGPRMMTRTSCKVVPRRRARAIACDSREVALIDDCYRLT